jgi:hypothetical protein
MRSLERRSMHAIFAPLDPEERLPRELIFERPPGWAWGIRIGRQHIAGFLWVPALFTTLGVFTWFGHPLLTLAAVGLLLLGFAKWAFRRDR